MTLLLMDECKITSERFFRGGHNSLLPFILYLVANPTPSPAEKRRLVVAVYTALMSGVFAGAEARMGAFARKECVRGKPFPLEKLTRLVASHYGIIHSVRSRSERGAGGGRSERRNRSIQVVCEDSEHRPTLHPTRAVDL